MPQAEDESYTNTLRLDFRNPNKEQLQKLKRVWNELYRIFPNGEGLATFRHENSWYVLTQEWEGRRFEEPVR